MTTRQTLDGAFEAIAQYGPKLCIGCKRIGEWSFVRIVPWTWGDEEHPVVVGMFAVYNCAACQESDMSMAEAVDALAREPSVTIPTTPLHHD